MAEIPPQGPDYPPYVSLCLISGDEGVIEDDQGRRGLDRLLKSVLDRSSGPMFDEVSIFWNGSPEKEPDYLKAGTYHTVHGFDVPIVVVRGPWRKHFAWARQQSFEAAHGVWKCYLDTDDQIPSADDQRVDAALESAGTTRERVTSTQGPVPPTLREWLKDLAPGFNAIVAPYFYVEIQGRPAVINPRTRIVRWADGWCWSGELHEDLFPIRGNIFRGADNGGLVVVPQPLRPSSDRLERNIEILLAAEAAAGGPDNLGHRQLHGIAAYHFDRGNNDRCVEYLQRALSTNPPPPAPDQFIYHCMAAQALCQLRRPQDAVGHAMWGVLVSPDRPGGYLELGRAYYMQGSYNESARWFREGFKRDETPLGSMQHPMAIGGQLRALGAHALLGIGAVEDALAWAETAVTADPGLFPERTLVLCRDHLSQKKTGEAYRLLAEHLLQRGEMQQLAALGDACPAILEDSAESHRLTLRVDYERAQPGADPETVTTALDVTAGVRERFAVPEGAKVIGSELAQVVDPDAVLARAEEGDAPVHVIVPDVRAPVPNQPPGAKTGFTHERLLRVLGKRGRVMDLRREQTLSLHGIAGDHRIGAWYVPGPRPSPKRVVIWCPHYAMPWGPASPRLQGTGGSEEAALYLSEELVTRGYDVTVYAPIPPGDQPLRVDNGVVWRHLTTFAPDLAVDHMIFHRAPAMAAVAPFAAKHLWTWHHDHFYSEEYWNPRVAQSTRHLYVSRWQRRVLEDLIGTKTAGRIVYNGVPPRQFADTRARIGPVPRNPHTVAYASMPTRGLDRLIDLWPEVVAAVPDARLFIYYGMQSARQLWRGTHRDVAALLAQLDTEVTRLASTGSVIYRGRIGQDALTEDFLQHGVLAYPTAFSEVYMISGARAAAAGMKVVSTDAAALPETLPDKTYMVEGAVEADAWANGGRARFLVTLLRAMTEPEDQYDREGVAARVLATYAWSHVARRFADAFSAAERGDTAYFESDVGIEPHPIAEGPADMRLPADDLQLESLRWEPLGFVVP